MSEPAAIEQNVPKEAPSPAPRNKSPTTEEVKDTNEGKLENVELETPSNVNVEFQDESENKPDGREQMDLYGNNFKACVIIN